MTILGLGTDIIHISRIQRLLLSPHCTPFLNHKATRFTQRILHPKHELPHYEQLINSGSSPQDIVRYIAGVWSIKESIYKALDGELQKKYGGFKQWWKINDQYGRPIIGGEYLELLKKESKQEVAMEKFWCSLSHDDDILISQVIWSRN